MPTDQDPPENPPADKQTESDRLDRAPPILWVMLGGVVVIAFVLLTIWLRR